MNYNLRFGMHRDCQLLHEIKQHFDGLVIPANILAHQSSPTAAFTRSLYDKQYVIDPMTFIVQNLKALHVNDKEEIRSSIKKLFDAYHSDLCPLIDGLGLDERLLPTAYPNLRELTENCIRFQLEHINEAGTASKAKKYLDRYKSSRDVGPRFVIPPYFHFVGTADRFYHMTIECASITQELGHENMAVVLLCPPSVLVSEPYRSQIIRDFSKYKHVILWVDDFQQSSASSDKIKGVRKTVRGLTEAGTKVEALYAGYMMMTMALDGLEQFSHGILYTQHKSFTLTPGSGGAPERYYIPGIWDFRSLSQTDIILHKHPELMCDCEVCKPVFDGDPDMILEFNDNPELLRKHFLCVRSREKREISGLSRSELSDRFKGAHDQFHESFSSLRNPDSYLPHSRISGLDYLLEWERGLV